MEATVVSLCATMFNPRQANRICSLISQGQEQKKKAFTIKTIAWLEFQSKRHNKQIGVQDSEECVR